MLPACRNFLCTVCTVIKWWWWRIKLRMLRYLYRAFLFVFLCFVTESSEVNQKNQKGRRSVAVAQESQWNLQKYIQGQSAMLFLLLIFCFLILSFFFVVVPNVSVLNCFICPILCLCTCNMWLCGCLSVSTCVCLRAWPHVCLFSFKTSQALVFTPRERA